MSVPPVIIGVVVGSVHAIVTTGGHHGRCATMGAGGRPTTADAGGHRCALMGVVGRPTSVDAGDLVTRGVATDAMMEAPLHRGCCTVVIIEGHRHAAMPATSAKVPARLCKPSFVVVVETCFSFHMLGFS